MKGGVQGETVLVFDLSASMQAREAGTSRLDEAKRRAAALLDSMEPGDRVTVLTAGSRVETRLSRSGDLARARTVIAGLQAENGGADMEAALSLARAMARDIDGLNIIVFSDVYTGEPPVQTVRVGTGAANRAVTALSLTEDGHAFVRAANYGPAAAVTLECYADGTLCDVVTLELAEEETRSALMQARQGAAVVQVRITEEDALTADNERWYTARGQSAYRVALCAANVFVEKAVALRPDIVLLRTDTADAAALENIDLYIFDGALPEKLPERGMLLCIAPDGPVLDILPGERKEQAGALRAAYGELPRALTKNLLLEDIALRTYTPLTGGQAVLRWNGDTLLSVTEAAGRRAAALGFDLHDSNLPMQGDFPVLMQNLLSWLLPDVRQALADGVCGVPVEIPADARAERAEIVLPSGHRIAAGAVLEETDVQGVYALEYTYADGTVRTARFSLHMDGAESDVRQIGGPGSAALSTAGTADAGRELTLWVLLAFLALYLVEWGVSRRVG